MRVNGIRRKKYQRSTKLGELTQSLTHFLVGTAELMKKND